MRNAGRVSQRRRFVWVRAFEFSGPDAVTFAAAHNRGANSNDFHMQHSEFVVMDLQGHFRPQLVAAAAQAGGKVPCSACCQWSVLRSTLHWQQEGLMYPRIRKIAGPDQAHEGWVYILAWKLSCSGCRGGCGGGGGGAERVERVS